MSHPASATPGPGIGEQSLRIVALLGLVIGLSFVAELIVLSWLRPSLDFFRGLFYSGWMPAVQPAVVPALLLILASLGACGYAGWRLASRGKSSLIVSGLLVAAVLVADLLVVAFVLPGILDPLTDLLSQNRVSDFGFLVGLLALIPLIIAVLVFRLRSWRWIGGGHVALAGVLVYLAADEPRRGEPLAFEQISPVFPGADASFNVLMRYGRNHPLGKTFREPNRIFRGNTAWVGPSKPAEWPAWLEAHRADVQEDWVDLAPVRAWIDELNTYDRIADLMPADVRAEIISFAPFRSYSNHAAQMAGLQAMAGHGDEAIATLLPLLQVSRKLEPSARSLVRAMTARTMQDTGLSAARFVLRRTAVSAEMRNRLADALKLGIGGEAGARHLLAIETTFFSAASPDRPLGDFIPLERRPELVRHFLNVTGPFLYNPHRTANLHREFSEGLQDIAARRDMAELQRAERSFVAAHADPKFKNFMGDFLVGAVVPAYHKVVERYWNIEDSRTSLLAELAQPTAGQNVAALATAGLSQSN